MIRNRPDYPFGLRALVIVVALFAVAFTRAADAQTRAPETAVDLALVLAVDASRSIDDWEYELQRQGYVAAFKDPQVVRAIRSGPHGAVAVIYVEWSSENEQAVLVDWTVVRDAETAAGFADRLGASERRFMARTSISGGIDFSALLLAESGIKAPRRAIDVSGDGINNRGRPVQMARDEAVKAGITVNGLAIINDRAQRWRPVVPLDEYFRDNVIGGPGAFLIVANDFESFGQAVRRKLVLEIAGCAPPLVPGLCADAGAGGRSAIIWSPERPAPEDPS